MRQFKISVNAKKLVHHFSCLYFRIKIEKDWTIIQVSIYTVETETFFYKKNLQQASRKLTEEFSQA